MQPLMGKVGTPDGQFHDGNPATGELGTIVSALWLNALQSATRNMQAEMLSVLAAAGLEADPDEINQLEVAIKQLAWGAQHRPTTLTGYGIDDGLRHYRAGQPLPNSDLGPIWHDDYASLMTWQAFTLNGASYTGYASVLVGSLLADTQPTPRAGYIKSGVQNLNRAAYAALRGWAMHNGMLVAPDTWAAGAIAMADNADGSTFRVFDVRGEFPRFWDDGRGVDSGRAFGSWQSGSPLARDDNNGAGAFNPVGLTRYADGATGLADAWVGALPEAFYTAPYGSLNAAVGTGFISMARSRNVPLLASIKF